MRAEEAARRGGDQGRGDADGRGPAQWTAAGAGAGAVADNWLAAFRDDQLNAVVAEAIAHNADLRVGAARVEQAHALRQAGRREALSVGRLARARRRQDVGGRLGLQGGVLTRQLGARPLGPRAVRPRRGSRRRCVRAGRFRVRAAVDRRARCTKLVPGHRGGPPGRAGARQTVGRREELVRLAETRSRVGVGNDEDVEVAQANVGTYRDALRQLELAREQALRAMEILIGRYPAAAASRQRAAAARSRTRYRPGFRRSCSSAAPMSWPPSGASPPPSTASARPRRRDCRRSP